MSHLMEHTTWYELILDTKVLNEQLTKCTTSQKVDLLNRLLYQVYSLNRITDMPPTVQATAAQKKQDVQAVCLKFASEVLWDVETLLDNIQPCLVENLLNYLIRFTRAIELPPTAIDNVIDGQLSIQQTSLIMWHLWVVLSSVKAALVRAGCKSERSLPLPKLAVTVVSGLTNPVTVLGSNNEVSLAGIARELPNSVAVLTKLSHRTDILAFLLPKTSAFLISTNVPAGAAENMSMTTAENTSLFVDSDFFLVRWSVLRAKIAYVLMKHYLLQSNYQFVVTLHSALQELLHDLPKNSELSEKFIATIDPTYATRCWEVAQAILNKSSAGSVIIDRISKHEFEHAVELFEANGLLSLSIPPSFFLEALYSQPFDEAQLLHLRLFFAIRAIIEEHSPLLIVNGCGLIMSAKPETHADFFTKLLDYFAQRWDSLEKIPRAVLASFVEQVVKLNPDLFCPIVVASSLVSHPEFREVGQFVFSFAVPSEVEMTDATSHASMIKSVLRGSPVEQLRLAFQLNDIRTAIGSIKPSSIDEVVQLLSPNSGNIPRRIITVLSAVTQIPNASFTLAFIVKARQLMEAGSFDDASLLLKEAQELASQMSAKVWNYVSCLYYSCEFERGNVMSLPVLFQHASSLVKAMLDAVDGEMLDSPDVIQLYVLMVSGVLNAKMYSHLMRSPMQSPIFLIGQVMASLHLCMTTQQLKQDGGSPVPVFGGQQDLKTVAKSFFEIIVQLHLSNELRGADREAGSAQSSRSSRNEPANPRPSFRDRASLSRAGPSGISQGGAEGFDDPKWRPHYELRFWWSLYSRITDPQLLIYLISCYSKLYSGIRTDLTCDVFNPHFSIWPPSVTSQLESSTKSSVGETLHFLLETLAKLAPDMVLTWRLVADSQVATNCQGAALTSYCRLFQVASKSFSLDPDPTVVDDIVLRSIIRCFTHLRCPMKVAVTTQFLSDPDYGVAFQSLVEYWTTASDADDALFPFVFDPVLLEFLINFYDTRGSIDDKKALLIKVAHQMTPDLNPNNAPVAAGKAAVKLAAKLGFFKMCFYEYCCS